MTGTNREFDGVDLGDARRDQRLGKIVERVSSAADQSFPAIARSEAELEALYRFLGNPAIEPEAILEPHVAATVRRCNATGAVVVIHDTSTMAFEGPERTSLGFLPTGQRGFFAHFSLASSDDGRGVPLGVIGMQTHFRARPPSKRGEAVKRNYDSKRNKESARWLRGIRESEALLPECEVVHLMDSECDSYGLLSALRADGIRFVTRLRSDRVVLTDEDGEFEPIGPALARLDAVCEREVVLGARRASSAPRANKSHPERRARTAMLTVSATRVRFRRSARLKTPAPATLEVNVVHILEAHPPRGEQKIEWRLVTTEPIDSAEQVTRIVDLYRQRWLIEEYFKALKTGCAYKRRQIESRQGLLNTLALFAPIAWQMLTLRALQRAAPSADARLVLSPTQIRVLRQMSSVRLPENPTLSEALRAIAIEGGHVRNRPIGWLTLARGFEKLLFVEYGYRLAIEGGKDVINE